MVNGCPQAFLNLSGRRKKRDLDERCKDVPHTESGVLSLPIAQAICNTDIKYIPNIVEGLAKSVELLNIAQDYDKKAFGDRKEKK